MSGERTDGLVHALLLDGAGGARSLEENALAAWQPEQGVLWVHVDLTQEAGREWIERHSGLDRVAIDALLADDTRPRELVEGDGLLLHLRGVNLNPGQDPEDMVAIRLWLDGQRIVSARHRRLLSVRDLVERLEAGRGPTTAGGVLADLVEALIERIADVVDATEQLASEIEETAIAEASQERRTELAELRRQVIALRRFLAPQREALSRLHGERLSWLADDEKARLRETSNRLMRYVEDLETVRDRATVTQEQIESRLSEQLNRRMYVLSIITAIFLPMSFLTGLLGVNLGGIPGASNELSFAVFASSLVAIGVFAAWLFLRSRWL
jgi:zinc transporter